MTTSRRNTIMLWMAYTEFFYPGCELQPGYFYPSMPELFYYTLEDGACIGAAGIDAYVLEQFNQGKFACKYCKEVITRNNLYAIIPMPNKNVDMCCNRPDCVLSLSEEAK